jgi:hypothetical protein
VSQRTIYRYLKTLSKLGSPDQVFDSGTEAGRKDRITEALEVNDLDLIDYCLRHNPLTRYPYFVERLSRIRRKIGNQRRRGDKGDRDFAFIDETPDTPPDTRQNEILERFTRAKVDSRKVAITVRDSRSQPRVMIPVAIKIGRDGVALRVTEHQGEEPTEISLANISRLVVSAESVQSSRAARGQKNRSRKSKTS